MAATVATLRPLSRARASARLRQLLCASGLTQQQAGALVGVDARQVRRWLRAEVPMAALELLVELEERAAGRRAA